MDDRNKKWYERLNLSLQDEDNRMDALIEIKNHLSNRNGEEDSGQLQLPLLFDCLNNANSDQVDLACEVLTICMSNLSVGETTERYTDSLIRSLNHPSPNVRLMALKEIERCTSDDTQIKALCDYAPIVLGLFDCVADEELSVANKAVEILSKIGTDEMGLTKLLQKTYFDQIMAGIQGPDIIRFRIYSIVVKIACSSVSGLQAMINHSCIGYLVKELQENDILLQLNALELLSDLAAVPHGRMYIENQQLLQNLSPYLERGTDDLTVSLLLPGLIKFFGNIAYWDPVTLFSTYSTFPTALLRIENFQDQTLFAITVDTIGHIGSTNRGKLVLNQYDVKIHEILEFLSRFIINLPSERQVRILNCFENLLRVQFDSDEKISDALTLTQKWYHYIGENPTALFLKYSKIPFPELRLASLSCYEAVSEQQWGQDVILKTAGLPEFLLDRSEENTKDTKDVKYLIIKNLFASESRFLTNFHKNLFEQFIKDGPYYSSMQIEVAIEGNAPN